MGGRRARGAGARLPGRRAPAQRALDVAVDGLRLGPSGTDPALRFALRTARGGALFDLGRPAGRAARTAGGPGRTGRHARARDPGGRRPRCSSTGRPCCSGLRRRGDDVLGPARRPRHRVGRARPHAGLVGGGRPVRRTGRARRSVPCSTACCPRPWTPPSWRPGSSRSGAPCDQAIGRRRVGRLRAALDLAEPLDLLRPFALAGQGLRVLLVDQLGGARDPDAFAFRCLTARRAAAEIARHRS